MSYLIKPFMLSDEAVRQFRLDAITRTLLKVKPPDCICPRWVTKTGKPTHYCIGEESEIDCPKEVTGCKYAQYKPVWKRMIRRTKWK